MRVYVAGPMTGYANYNYGAFYAAAHRWHAAGHRVINPAENFNGRQDLPYSAYMQQAILNVMSVDALALLPGWDKSKGAQMEVAIAAQLGLDFYDATTMLPIRLVFDGIDYHTITGPVPMVAVIGKMKAGKSTLSEALVKVYGIPRRSFARPLKQGAATMGLDTADFSPTKDVKGLQDIGSYFRENYGDDHWVDLLDANTPKRATEGIIVDDCRFPNELEWCRRNGLVTVKLKVSRATQLARGADPAVLDKISETALDHLPDSAYDVVVDEGTPVKTTLDLFRQYITRRYEGESLGTLYIRRHGTGWIDRPGHCATIEPVTNHRTAA